MEMLNLLCASEEVKSTGSKRKVATEKLKTTTRLKKMKPGTLHKLIPYKRPLNSDLSDHRHNTKNQNKHI